MKDHGEETAAVRGHRDPVTQTTIASWSGREVSYRGYNVTDLVRDSTFTEVAYLLLYGELPCEVFLADFRAVLCEASSEEEWADDSGWLGECLERLPLHVPLLQSMLTGISGLAHCDPQPTDHSLAADRARAIRLVGRLPVLLAARLAVVDGTPRSLPDDERSYPAQLATLITGHVPSPLLEKAIDVLLMCSIDVEFSPPVQAARLAAAVGGDMYSAVLAAISVETTAQRVCLAEELVNLWESRVWVGDAEGWVLERLESGRGCPGALFGGSAIDDSRRGVLAAWAEHLAAESADGVKVARDDAAAELESAIIACGGTPAWDWAAVRLLAAAGVAAERHLPLVAVARLVGWAAHVLEQSGRPVASVARPHYVGPAAREIPSRTDWD